MIADIIKGKTPVSAYQPAQDVIDLIAMVQRDYADGIEILHRARVEFNDESVVTRTNKDQRTFNSYVDLSVEDPREAWKWRGTRSLARNKAMAMHAHLTAQYIIPRVFPQNEGQPDDKDMAEAMRDCVDWMTVNSSYRPAFLAASLGVLVNPVTYFVPEWCSANQKIKEKIDNGYRVTEIMDEVLSGFQPKVFGPTEVLITNLYEQDIQCQRSLIRRRFVEKSELEAVWGSHPNWDYVQEGYHSVYNDEDGLFYDVYDDDHPHLVAEEVWKSRRDDSEVVFLGGVYVGNENIEWNPIKHRDNRNAPKYNEVPLGYERIGEHFYFFKSMMFRVGWDDQLIDAMYEMQMNREFLDLDTPLSFSGVEKVDTSVIFPGSTIALSDKDAKVTPLIPPSSGNGYRAMREIEDSMSEASLSETQQGVLPEASQKAFTVAQTARNARILLSGVKKTLAESVRQVGNLMVDLVVNHLSVAEVDEITGSLKYRTLLLSEQTVNGKNISKKIRFDEALVGRSMSLDERKTYMMRMLSSIGYPDNKEEMIVVNPHLFSKMRYLIQVEPDVLEPKNEEAEKIIAERLYTLLRREPLVDPEMLVRDLLRTFYRSRADDFIANNPQGIMGAQPMDAKPLPSPVKEPALAVS